MEYDSLLKNTFEKYKLEIIEMFQKESSDGRTFDYSINKIKKRIQEDQFKNIIFKHQPIFNNSIYYFNNFEELYKVGTSVSVLINNEILNDYNKSFKDYKIKESPNHELYNYGFESFIKDLSEYDTLVRIEARLSLNYDLYELFFKVNQYKDFTLDKFEVNINETEIYKKYYQLLYGKGVKFETESPNVKIDEFSINKKDQNELEIIKFNISKFSKDEKIFLLNVLKNTKNKIPVSELGKLFLITNDTYDYSIFFEKTNNNKFYQKLNKGIDYYSPNTQRQFIDDVINKLEPFKLININIAVRSIKNKIL